MNRGAIRQCRWREPGGLAEALRIGGFLEAIGIAVEAGPVGESVIPGMTVRLGRVRVDPQIAAYPGDLLHEAGHVAVSDPARRATIEAIPVDPGDEMAAIAWSVAAAKACGTALETLFFDDGYKGNAGALRAAFGMTAEPRRAAEWGVPAFPEMTRWLR